MGSIAGKTQEDVVHWQKEAQYSWYAVSAGKEKEMQEVVVRIRCIREEAEQAVARIGALKELLDHINHVVGYVEEAALDESSNHFFPPEFSPQEIARAIATLRKMQNDGYKIILENGDKAYVVSEPLIPLALTPLRRKKKHKKAKRKK